jgi:amino acid transporter
MDAMMTLAVVVMVVGFASVCMAAVMYNDKETRKTGNSVGFFGLAAFACGLGVILVSLPGSGVGAEQGTQVPVDGPSVVQTDERESLSV